MNRLSIWFEAICQDLRAADDARAEELVVRTLAYLEAYLSERVAGQLHAPPIAFAAPAAAPVPADADHAPQRGPDVKPEQYDFITACSSEDERATHTIKDAFDNNRYVTVFSIEDSAAILHGEAFDSVSPQARLVSAGNWLGRQPLEVMEVAGRLQVTHR